VRTRFVVRTRGQLIWFTLKILKNWIQLKLRIKFKN
jgi:hypothetical protein